MLIVDDVRSIREAILQYLKGQFSVLEASCAEEAIEICAKNKIHLVITDMKMPGMSGVEMISILRNSDPDMQFVLMTAYNIDDLIGIMRKENIWNIVPKSVFLEPKQILTLAHKLFCSDPFGIHYYFPDAQIREIHISDVHRMHKELGKGGIPRENYYRCRINTPEENRCIGGKVSQLLLDSGGGQSVPQVVEELSANALRCTPEGEGFELCFGFLEGNSVLGFVDYQGLLDCNQILLNIERQVTIDEISGLPIGLEDTSGRGLYISREECESLIFNLDPGKKTEIIGILKETSMHRTRGISIFQKSDSSPI